MSTPMSAVRFADMGFEKADMGFENADMGILIFGLADMGFSVGILNRVRNRLWKYTISG